MKTSNPIIRTAFHFVSKLVWLWKALGPLKAARLLFEVLVIEINSEWIRSWRDSRFDRRYNVITAGFRTLAQLGLADSDHVSHNYRGTPEALFKAALGELPIDWRQFEFVDYGSGMGKALLLAARLPFRRITGVEFSAELHAAAERNIANWRLPDQRCLAVRSILADASSWLIPEGNCLLYFFNPFRPVLLRTILAHIITGAKPERQLYLVYIHPSYPEVFAEFPNLIKTAELTIRHSLYSIYKVAP